jgi:hypothetical protein
MRLEPLFLIPGVLWTGFLCFVSVFLYFVSRSPFILDLLCLVYCGFSMCVFIFLYLVSLSPFISEYKQNPRNSQSTRHKRSKVKGDLDTKYKNTDTKQRNPVHKTPGIKNKRWWRYKIQEYFVSLSPFILDLLCLVYCGFLCFCLYSCILYLYHLLF